MIYLVTGANGCGKTLNTLKWVREQSIKESRPVYYNGRFEMVADFGWTKFEFADWLTLPDGAILLVDECHNDLPVRGNSAAVPECVRMLAEHRRRGFDFYLITQHPQNIDLFVRRLIGSPGWHRHLKRSFGVDMVSCLEWSAVNSNCEKAGAGKDAKVSMIAFPKEVYKWYNSASLHTGKKSIPKQVYFLAVALLAIPAMGYFAFSSLTKGGVKAPALAAVTTSTFTVSPSRPQEKQVMTAAEYGNSFTPRVEGFPGSASRYDGVTQVTQAPKPAACVTGKRPGQKTISCECWSQQATKIQVPYAMCVQIALNGWFDDTAQVASLSTDGVSPGQTKQPPSSAAGTAAAPYLPAAEPFVKPIEAGELRTVAARDADVLGFMARRSVVR